jgi:hypothetical protein
MSGKKVEAEGVGKWYRMRGMTLWNIFSEWHLIWESQYCFKCSFNPEKGGTKWNQPWYTRNPKLNTDRTNKSGCTINKRTWHCWGNGKEASEPKNWKSTATHKGTVQQCCDLVSKCVSQRLWTSDLKLSYAFIRTKQVKKQVVDERLDHCWRRKP